MEVKRRLLWRAVAMETCQLYQLQEGVLQGGAKMDGTLLLYANVTNKYMFGDYTAVNLKRKMLENGIKNRCMKYFSSDREN